MAGAANPSICKIGPPTAAYEGPNRLSTGPAKSKQPALAAMLAKAHTKSENFKRPRGHSTEYIWPEPPQWKSLLVRSRQGVADVASKRGDREIAAVQAESS